MLDFQAFLLILLVVAGAVGALIYFFSSQINNLKSQLQKDDSEVLMTWLKEMKQSVEKNSEVMERQLSEQRKSLAEQLADQRTSMDKRTKLLWERLDDTSKTIQGVHKHLGGLQEFGRDMKDLSNILKSPKLRGGLGEQFLNEILGNNLPHDLFKTQYKFNTGEIADAVIMAETGLIPIDSKFPMENFRLMHTVETEDERARAKKVFIRDVKKRIDEIASKYILPEQGTTDYAVMYIPSENVFYELIVNTPEIEEYARNKRVFMSSPNTLSYQVKSILVMFKQKELYKNTGEILKALSGIKTEAGKFQGELEVLSGHIGRTNKSMENVNSKYLRLFGKIESVERLGETENQILLEDQ